MSTATSGPLPASPSLSRHVVRTSSSLGSSPSMNRSMSGGVAGGSGSLPPPPSMAGRRLYPGGAAATTATTAPTSKSMTIEEMRQLHQKALSDAEAKRTELRLVLASRYRELVGSSDEVLRMRERSQELHQLVHALPHLLLKLKNAAKDSTAVAAVKNGSRRGTATASTTPPITTTTDEDSTAMLQAKLSKLPRLIHRALDEQDVHKAASTLILLFSLIAEQTDIFPLANALGNAVCQKKELTPALTAQLKMTYLHVEPLPARTLRMSKSILLQPSSSAQRSASALTTLHLLQDNSSSSTAAAAATPLLDLYFDSKAKLLQSLLEQVDAVDNAEAILTQIVAILQHDIILHPYQIFVLKEFPGTPVVELDLVKTKASHFLAAHLPLIRTKVKSVLVSIAGTTASALGQIRQSLYDKTALDLGQDAIFAMVDVKIVLQSSASASSTNGDGSGTTNSANNKFSLWSALFSNTFSSLVHNLLTTSFHSVHASVVSTLRASLANAPPVMLPHEAHRNTLRIATDLNAALLRVSDDAHELLVHAEERVESEGRLRQSLYVQTCEIMGRLVCELRRMGAAKDATYLVGRLCHLLTFRLTTLQKLLHPSHSPGGVNGAGSMNITLTELQAAFELADDNDDGLITIQEAMEACDAAFSGTPFHGAEMVRETLLLSSNKDTAPLLDSTTVTLHELALLCARGLNYTGAMETIQESLHSIIQSCFSAWSEAALTNVTAVVVPEHEANPVSEAEWQRMYKTTNSSSHNSSTTTKDDVGEFKEFIAADDPTPATPGPPLLASVSPAVVGYFLSVASILERNVCPADDGKLVNAIRQALLYHGLEYFVQQISSSFEMSTANRLCASALIQHRVNFGFVHFCLLERNKFGFASKHEDAVENCRSKLDHVLSELDKAISTVWYSSTLTKSIHEQHLQVLQASELYLSSLLGQDDDAMLDTITTSTLFLQPLPSSRRFALLPVQESDRTLAELQRRGNNKFNTAGEKDKDEGSSGASGVMAGGLGFFSSMLKKK